MISTEWSGAIFYYVTVHMHVQLIGAFPHKNTIFSSTWISLLLVSNQHEQLKDIPVNALAIYVCFTDYGVLHSIFTYIVFSHDFKLHVWEKGMTYASHTS